MNPKISRRAYCNQSTIWPQYQKSTSRGWLVNPSPNHFKITTIWKGQERLKTDEHAPYLQDFFHPWLRKKTKVEISSDLKFYRHCLRGREIKRKDSVIPLDMVECNWWWKFALPTPIQEVFTTPKKCGTTKYQIQTSITILMLVSPGTLV